MKRKYDLSEPGFRVGNIDIQNVRRPQGYSHSYRSGRIKHGFVYTVSGRMHNEFSDTEISDVCVLQGELMFIPAGTRYVGNYLDENTEIKIVQFDIVSGELPEYLSAPRKLELPNAGELIESFFTRIESRVSGHPFYYLSCLYNLLWQIEESTVTVPQKYKRLTPALLELAEHWYNSEPISYYADLCYMSEVNFRRLFREFTEKSPIEYRNDVRLAHAKVKLASGEYNVTEVAEACGFSNLSFFIRLYKKKYGTTPKRQ